MDFKSLHIAEPILRALHEEGYRTPTPIQAQAIPIVLHGKDLLGVAQTGTGKTAAFSIPLLQILAERKHQGRDKKYSPKRRAIQSLILTPTRELAIQIDDSIKAYGRHLKLNSAVIFGGVSQGAQTNALRKGVDIVVATPGRLLDLMDQGYIDLGQIEIFVLDEADRMLDMGFVRDVHKVIEELPRDRQTLFFSATMPPAIVKLANDILRDPIKVEVTPVSSTVDLIEQSLYFVEKKQKLGLLMQVIEDFEMPSVLVFTRTKYGADNVVRTLNRNHIKAEAIHGNKAQNARQRALNNFKEGKTQVLVATDIAARGIDVDDLEFVINYEIPNVSETYVHRIGRTGRAGAAGAALSFCAPEEKADIKAIEKLIGKRIPVVYEHPFAKPVDQERSREDRDGREARGGRKRSYSEDRERKQRDDRRSGGGERSRQRTERSRSAADAPRSRSDRSDERPREERRERPREDRRSDDRRPRPATENSSRGERRERSSEAPRGERRERPQSEAPRRDRDEQQRSRPPGGRASRGRKKRRPSR
jgi:ATP-dependent RNA helicase RhlE